MPVWNTRCLHSTQNRPADRREASRQATHAAASTDSRSGAEAHFARFTTPNAYKSLSDLVGQEVDTRLLAFTRVSDAQVLDGVTCGRANTPAAATINLPGKLVRQLARSVLCFASAQQS